MRSVVANGMMSTLEHTPNEDAVLESPTGRRGPRTRSRARGAPNAEGSQEQC
jgi:hypothetical protein